LDASKIVGFDYKYNDKESTLTIQLDTSKWDFRLKKEVLFSYNLNVDDSTIPNDAVVYSITNGQQTKKINSTDFLINDFYESNGIYYIVVLCKSGGCNCNGTFITSLGVLSPNNTNSPWCNGQWQNIPSGCTDSSVGVLLSVMKNCVALCSIV
jgi:hypothetical protein